jgi:hypothetical protein
MRLDKPVAGTVTALAAGQSHAPSTVVVGNDGRFTMTLPSGMYQFIGHSPRRGDGKYLCTAHQPVAIAERLLSVVTAPVINVTVICRE